ncbi:MAG: ATP-binding protein [Thermoleophilia bacterium]|nr:ATP-binding protein [Thermoleophilia bacterium]
MVPEIGVEEYAAFLSAEYLESFVGSGGSAVKVAVVPDPRHAGALNDDVMRRAGLRSYTAVAVDSACTRVHLIQQIFFAVAAELDWAAYARKVVDTMLVRIYGEDVRGAGTLEQVARLTELDETLVRTEVGKALSNDVLRNYALAKDFRIAMMHLCLAELEPEAYTEEGRLAVLEWLRGELRLISALKEMSIFQRIARHNARSILASTARWVHQAGSPGLCLVINAGRLAVSRRGDVADEGLYYTPAAVMDAYEVLRQFIDATDEMEHVMILVVAPAELLDAESKRGFAAYPALRNRIWDDVRDRNRVNPCAPMVRIAGDRGGG